MANVLQLLTSGVQSVLASVTTSAGAGDAGKLVETDGSGLIDGSFLGDATSATSMTATVKTGVTLVAGDLVAIDSAGEVVKADATDGTEIATTGYVKAGFAAGATATIYEEGEASGTNITGLTIGGRVYLAQTAGQLTQTAPTDGMVQDVGYAIAADKVRFVPSDPIIF